LIFPALSGETVTFHVRDLTDATAARTLAALRSRLDGPTTRATDA
jgi:hypothetical protein